MTSLPLNGPGLPWRARPNATDAYIVTHQKHQLFYHVLRLKAGAARSFLLIHGGVLCQ
jgi:hypothetical protein